RAPLLRRVPTSVLRAAQTMPLETRQHSPPLQLPTPPLPASADRGVLSSATSSAVVARCSSCRPLIPTPDTHRAAWSNSPGPFRFESAAARNFPECPRRPAGNLTHSRACAPAMPPQVREYPLRRPATNQCSPTRPYQWGPAPAVV